MRQSRLGAKGQVLVLVALMMVVLLAVAALALDVGLAYGVKAKMSAAADAAAIAALKERTSGTGTDYSAETVARAYFNANFPDSLGIPAPDCHVTVIPQDGSFVAHVEASAVLPTFFAKMLGWRGLTVTARSEATRSNLDVALVLDTTSSLGAVFSNVQSQAQAFVNRFSASNDRMALVPFATGVGLVDAKGELMLTQGVEINKSCRGFNRAALNSAISSLSLPSYTSYTNSEFGLRIGLYQLNKVTNPAGHRAIVFFSDGAPNTFSGVFSVDAGGATVQGSLFSGTTSPNPPSKLYPANLTSHDPFQVVSLFKLPEQGGGNSIGSVRILPQLPVTSRQRSVSASGNLKCEANKAARNLLENVASYARSQGIVIYSIGFGDRLDQPDISGECSTSSESGSMILKRIANTTDSDTYDGTQRSGIYCRAVNADQLGGCFDAIANALLRLTR